MPTTLRRQPSARTRAARTIQRSFRRKRAVRRPGWFNTRRPRPEMKKAHYTEDDITVTSAALNYNKLLAGQDITQGLSDVAERVGNRITGKYLNVKFLFENTSDTKAQILRYCIWMPRSTTQQLSIDGISNINNKLFKVMRQGYISVNHDSARVFTVNIPLKNKVFTYSGDDISLPINEDRIYLTMVTVTGTMTLRVSMNTNFWYTDS